MNQTGDMLGRVETRFEKHNDREEEDDTNHIEREGERDRLVLYQGRGERDPDS